MPTFKKYSVKTLENVDNAFRWARFRGLLLRHRLGVFSSIPFPIVNQTRSGNAEKGTHAFHKLETIIGLMPQDAHTVVDIGSNNGFYAIHLAQRGYDVLGYEPVESFVRGCNQICEEFDVPNAAFMSRGIDPETSAHLFPSDVTLALSVFHNWVKQHDFAAALKILQNLWGNTRQVMFFELANTVDNKYIAGFDTMPSMGSTVEECGSFIEREILGVLPAAKIELVGLMPTDYVNGSARHFFVVRRGS